jgi:hypothetical protein
VPMAQTWLHQERWDDEPPKRTAAVVPLTAGPTCGECVEGWRQTERGVVRCACRARKSA